MPESNSVKVHFVHFFFVAVRTCVYPENFLSGGGGGGGPNSQKGSDGKFQHGKN